MRDGVRSGVRSKDWGVRSGVRDGVSSEGWSDE